MLTFQILCIQVLDKCEVSAVNVEETFLQSPHKLTSNEDTNNSKEELELENGNGQDSGAASMSTTSALDSGSESTIGDSKDGSGRHSEAPGQQLKQEVPPMFRVGLSLQDSRVRHLF